jgi:hypothetical protein
LGAAVPSSRIWIVPIGFAAMFLGGLDAFRIVAP